MEPRVFDLRGYSRGTYLLTLVISAVVGFGLLYAVGIDAVGPGVSRVVAGVIGGAFGLGALLGASQFRAIGRARRLVIDHEGIRVDTERRADRFRVAWTELAGVGLVLSDRRRRRARRRYHHVGDLPPDVVAVTLFLDMVPVDGEAVRRHPELQRAWIIGGRRSWRVWLGTAFGDPLDVAAALEQRRPDLWRGQRSGSGLFG